MLDVRRLNMLRTVAARGSITAAAQSLDLTAGAVSQQLAALRDDVGVDLLRPDGRTVTLTEAGRVLVEHADRILAAVREAESAVAAVKGAVGEAATLAALPSTVVRIVAPALTALGERHPRLTVTCLVTDQAQLRELALGTVDVVLGQRYHHLPEDTPKGVEITPLLDDPLLVVTAADRAGGRPVALRELATHSLALPPSGTDCGQAVLQACRQAGFAPTARYVTTDTSAQLALARAGLATALVPRTAVDPDAPGIRTASIEDRPIVRRLFAATRRTGSADPTSAAVVTALRTAALEGREGSALTDGHERRGAATGANANPGSGRKSGEPGAAAVPGASESVRTT
ncbi:LysR family transcriptional regulator [Streptomyces narbonensis]|uniref:LysR family transcriptional regulator n=1 Tax=Streptomyces narbonensis TaxID=67333 RepID=UPI0033DC570B